MIRPFLSATAFLTRIPVPPCTFADETAFARSPAFFGWVGWLVALALWAGAQTCSITSPRLAALGVLAVWVWITGGLHLDGLADTADGLGGARGSASRALEIMRDSRIGAHGAVALFFLLVLKWTALEACLARGTWLWLAAPVAARLLCTLQLAWFPYGREHGLGSGLNEQVGLRAVLVSASALAPALVLFDLRELWFAPISVMVGLLVGFRLSRMLGGITGDGYGASIELTEAAALLLCSLDLR